MTLLILGLELCHIRLNLEMMMRGEQSPCTTYEDTIDSMDWILSLNLQT